MGCEGPAGVTGRSACDRGTDVGCRVWEDMILEVGDSQVVDGPAGKLRWLSFVLKL